MSGPEMRADLIEVTDGHIAAYRKGATEAVDGTRLDGEARSVAAIRGGLAAVQFAVLNETPKPSPEMQEVTAWEGMRNEDTVTVVGRLRNDIELGGVDRYVLVSGDNMPMPYRDSSNFFVVVDPSFTVTRPVTSLPKNPGAVIRCRIKGKINVYIAERYEGGWLVAGLANSHSTGYPGTFEDWAIGEVITVLDPGRELDGRATS